MLKIKIRSNPEYRAKLVTNILHSLNQEVWDKIKNKRQWFWLQEYRKLPKVKDYIRTYEKQYRQGETYKEWDRAYRKKKRQEEPERYRQYSRNHYWKNGGEEGREKHREWSARPENRKKALKRRMEKYYETREDPIEYRKHLDEINERKRLIRREKKLGIHQDRRVYGQKLTQERRWKIVRETEKKLEKQGLLLHRTRQCRKLTVNYL